jgi:hypothetical protein
MWLKLLINIKGLVGLLGIASLGLPIPGPTKYPRGCYATKEGASIAEALLRNSVIHVGLQVLLG